METKQGNNGSPSHKVLVAEAQSARQCAMRMLEESSRDFDVLRTFVERYAHFQSAADYVSGQSDKLPRYVEA